jgi:DNA-binding MarR family transcriptional regulator
MSASPPEPHTALPHLLVRAKEAFIAEAHRRMRLAGYPEVSGNFVVFRWLAPEGSRLSEMVECSGMTKQAFGEHVAALEANGFLTRTPDPADGRAKLVVPTERGLAARADLRQTFAEIEAEWAAAVGAERIAELRDTLARIAALPS